MYLQTKHKLLAMANPTSNYLIFSSGHLVFVGMGSIIAIIDSIIIGSGLTYPCFIIPSSFITVVRVRIHSYIVNEVEIPYS